MPAPWSVYVRVPALGCLIVVIAGVAFLFVAGSAIAPLTKQEMDDAYIATLSASIKRSEPALLRYAEEVLGGAIPEEEGTRGYPCPILNDPALKILCVTKDSNRNVYFILADSWVTFNVGFVLQFEERPLLGDGQEPTIVYQEHLFGRWWYYKAS